MSEELYFLGLSKLVSTASKAGMEEELSNLAFGYRQRLKDMLTELEEQGYKLVEEGPEIKILHHCLHSRLDSRDEEVRIIHKEKDVLQNISKWADRVAKESIEDYFSSSQELSSLPEDKSVTLKDLLLTYTSKCLKMTYLCSHESFFDEIAKQKEEGRLDNFLEEVGIEEEFKDFVIKLVN